LHSILSFLTDFGDTAVTVPLAILVAGFLLAARQPRLAIGWAVVIIGCAGMTAALKMAFAICGHPVGGARLMSPSGHTAMSIAVYGGLAAVIAGSLAAPARLTLYAGAAIFGIGIALSRTIVGYHTPTEVVIGFAVGFAALAVMVGIVIRYRPRDLPIGWLVPGALVVFVLFHGTRWPAEQAIHGLAWWLEILRPYCS
jgi:membrane-associated phospholipid phosphatase